MLRATILLILLSSSSLTCWANPTVVGINQPRKGHNYMLGLLKLTLSYSENKYTFVEQPELLSKAAEYEATLAGKIAVFWSGTTQEHEEKFIPIPIDGYRG